MQIVRYAVDGGSAYGVIDGTDIRELDGLSATTAGAVVGPLDDLTLLAPCEPTKVVCVGRNYAAHVREMGRDWPQEPFSFMKGPNSVIGPNGAALRPAGIERFDFEGELTVVFGRRAKRVPAENWKDYVVGFTCGNDFTIRDWQLTTVQWFRAKSSDALCALGPWIETEIDDPGSLAIRTTVDGEVRQDSTTSDLIFTVPKLIEFLSATVTFEPGDVVLTGTPGGVGNIEAGQVVEVEIEKIGTLRSTVAEA